MGSFTDKKIVLDSHRRSQKLNNLDSQNRNKGSFTEETIEIDNSCNMYGYENDSCTNKAIKNNNSYNKDSCTDETIEIDNSCNMYGYENDNKNPGDSFKKDVKIGPGDSFKKDVEIVFQDDNKDILYFLNAVKNCKRTTRNGNKKTVGNKNNETDKIIENSSYYVNDSRRFPNRNNNSNKGSSTDKKIVPDNHRRFPDRNNNPYNTDPAKKIIKNDNSGNKDRCTEGKIIKNDNSDNKGSSTDETDETIYIEDDVCEISLNSTTQRTK